MHIELQEVPIKLGILQVQKVVRLVFDALNHALKSQIQGLQTLNVGVLQITQETV